MFVIVLDSLQQWFPDSHVLIAVGHFNPHLTRRKHLQQQYSHIISSGSQTATFSLQYATSINISHDANIYSSNTATLSAVVPRQPRSHCSTPLLSTSHTTQTSTAAIQSHYQPWFPDSHVLIAVRHFYQHLTRRKHLQQQYSHIISRGSQTATFSLQYATSIHISHEANIYSSNTVTLSAVVPRQPHSHCSSIPVESFEAKQ